MLEKDLNQNTIVEAREKAQSELQKFGGLSNVSKMLSQQLKMPNLRYFGSEKEEAVERREDWLEGEEFANSRMDMKNKLEMLVNMLESSDDVAGGVTHQKEQLKSLADKNLQTILKKSRKLEKSWRELDLFYTNAAEEELRQVTILNADPAKMDDCLLYTSPSPRDRTRSRMPSSA